MFELDTLRYVALGLAMVMCCLACYFMWQTKRIIRKHRAIYDDARKLAIRGFENDMEEIRQKFGDKFVFSDEMVTPEDLEADAFHEECGDR